MKKKVELASAERFIERRKITREEYLRQLGLTGELTAEALDATLAQAGLKAESSKEWLRASKETAPSEVVVEVDEKFEEAIAEKKPKSRSRKATEPDAS